MHFICQFGFNQVFKSRGVKSALRDFNCLLSTNFIINFINSLINFLLVYILKLIFFWDTNLSNKPIQSSPYSRVVERLSVSIDLFIYNCLLNPWNICNRSKECVVPQVLTCTEIQGTP